MFIDANVPTHKKKESVVENTPVAGIAPVVGSGSGSLFITQYTIPCSFSSEGRVKGYALSNDIISKKVVTVDSENVSVKESEDFFKDRKIRIFKYIGENAEDKFLEIYKNIGNEKSDSYIYEVISGKKLLSDDQIECDPLFKEIDFDQISGETSADIASIYSGYKEACGDPVVGLPLMSDSDLNEEYELIKGNSNISVLETMNGCYAINNVTGRRTACYAHISDIPVSVL